MDPTSPRNGKGPATVAGRMPLIICYLKEANLTRTPFGWTPDPDKIIAAVKRGREVLDSIY